MYCFLAPSEDACGDGVAPAESPRATEGRQVDDAVKKVPPEALTRDPAEITEKYGLEAGLFSAIRQRFSKEKGDEEVPTQVA